MAEETQTEPQENQQNEEADLFGDWVPKSKLGKKVRDKEITNIDEILDVGSKIYEAKITEVLLPNLESDLLLIGQSKGKFGGGQRRAFRQTQKKTKEGNQINFQTAAIVGNKNGYVGIGFGKSQETVPAREKALRVAKKNIIRIGRGCGSWRCSCNYPHTVPFKIKGKCGSVEVELIPAPKGTGLIVENECGKILQMAGIVDVWSKTKGQIANKINLIYATMDALRKTVSTHTLPEHKDKIGFMEGPQKGEGEE